MSFCRFEACERDQCFRAIGLKFVGGTKLRRCLRPGALRLELEQVRQAGIGRRRLYANATYRVSQKCGTWQADPHFSGQCPQLAQRCNPDQRVRTRKLRLEYAKVCAAEWLCQQG